MNIIFLGTGTSIGVPAIGCDCPVCLSADPCNRRRRASLYIEACGLQVIIDTSPDFREQVLAFKIRRLDAVLLTHAHVDHILGFDDIRRFNQVQKSVIPVYGLKETLADLSRVFPYIHQPEKPGLSYPRVSLNAVAGTFKIGEIRITPVMVRHADIPTCGYRIEAEGRAIGYVPDCQELDEAALSRLQGLDLMILDTLRRRPHPTHFNLEESVSALQRLRARQSYLTHICHDLDHRQTNAGLPAGISLAYDGLEVSL